MKKSLINAIKKLFTKLGAQEVEGNNLVDVINNGADMIEGGVADDLFFDIVVTYDGNSDYTANKTYAQITSAIQSDKQVRVKYDGGIYYCAGAYSGMLNFSQAVFARASNNVQIEIFTLDNNNVWSFVSTGIAPK